MSTNGGNADVGQVWEYQPRDRDKDTLTLARRVPEATAYIGVVQSLVSGFRVVLAACQSISMPGAVGASAYRHKLSSPTSARLLGGKRFPYIGHGV